MEIVLLALMTFASGFFVLLRLVPWHLVLKMHWAVDVAFTALLLAILAGTLQGALVAALAGLLLSVTLTLGRLAERLKSAAYRLLKPE